MNSWQVTHIILLAGSNPRVQFSLESDVFIDFWPRKQEDKEKPLVHTVKSSFLWQSINTDIHDNIWLTECVKNILLKIH